MNIRGISVKKKYKNADSKNLFKNKMFIYLISYLLISGSMKTK